MPLKNPIFSSASMRTAESRRISCAPSATASMSFDFHFMRFGSGGGSPTIHITCPAASSVRVIFHKPGPG